MSSPRPGPVAYILGSAVELRNSVERVPGSLPEVRGEIILQTAGIGTRFALDSLPGSGPTCLPSRQEQRRGGLWSSRTFVGIDLGRRNATVQKRQGFSLPMSRTLTSPDTLLSAVVATTTRTMEVGIVCRLCYLMRYLKTKKANLLGQRRKIVGSMS